MTIDVKKILFLYPSISIIDGRSQKLLSPTMCDYKKIQKNDCVTTKKTKKNDFLC